MIVVRGYDFMIPLPSKQMIRRLSILWTFNVRTGEGRTVWLIRRTMKHFFWKCILVFFEKEYIRSMKEEWICEEMILRLDEFDPSSYSKSFDSGISFGIFQGSLNELHAAVEQVVPEWVKLYDDRSRVYCGFINGKIASFCIIENMGEHFLDGRRIKIGGPGCVGTVPEYRKKGIGLMMVRNVTQILKEERYDFSYIHYTGVAPWYHKLGYRTILKWNKHGIL